jgi:hypothetical protein
MVEFALMAVFFLFLIVAVVDIGRAFYAVITITNAAREGARYATMPNEMDVNPTDGINSYEEGRIKSRVVIEASLSNPPITLDLSKIVITCIPAAGPGTGNLLLDCQTGADLVVNVEYQMPTLIGIFFTQNITLRREIIMRIL